MVTGTHAHTHQKRSCQTCIDHTHSPLPVPTDMDLRASSSCTCTVPWAQLCRQSTHIPRLYPPHCTDTQLVLLVLCSWAHHPALLGLTQVIFVQRDLLHQRRHDKGEGLAVEVVQAVASKHGREDHGSVIAVASGCHGGKKQALLAGTQSL